MVKLPRRRSLMPQLVLQQAQQRGEFLQKRVP